MNSYLVKFELARDSYIVLKLNEDHNLKEIVHFLVNHYKLTDDFNFKKLINTKNISVLELVDKLKLNTKNKITIETKNDHLEFNIKLLDSVDYSSEIEIVNEIGDLDYVIEYDYLPSKYSVRKFNTEKEKFNKELFLELDNYFLAAANLYGIICLSELFMLVHNYNKEIDEKLFYDFAKLISHQHSKYFIASEKYFFENQIEVFSEWKLIVRNLIDNPALYQFVKKCQKGLPLTILEKNNFLMYKNAYHIDFSNEFKELYLYLVNNNVEFTIDEIKYLQQNPNYLFKLQSPFENNIETNEYKQLLNNYYKHSRVWRYRGATLDKFIYDKELLYLEESLDKIRNYTLNKIENISIKEKILNILTNYQNSSATEIELIS